MSDASETARAKLSDEARARHDALRAEVRRLADSEGRPMTELAREVGIPYGTFSGWAGGTYAGRIDRLDDQVARWLAGRDAALRKRAELPSGPAFVQTPASDLFLACLEHAQHAPDLVVITGAAGVGKTTAALHYRLRATNTWIITAEPCLRTPRALLDVIADQLGVTASGSSHRVSQAVVARMRGTRGLLIVDEAQHLATDLLDQLRTIHDLAEIGVALVGNERVHSRIEGGSRSPDFAQLFSRVGMRATRARPARGDIDAILDGWQVTDAGARKLLAVVGRKPGALRGMVKTLRIALMQATAGGEALAGGHVQLAYEHLAAASLDGAA